jgi:hypothetical protein
LTTDAGSVALGARVSSDTAIVRNGGLAVTATAAACALVSGAVRLTFGFGDAGLPAMIDAMKTVSWFAPVSITSRSPAARPVVLPSRIAVAPAAAAWLRPPVTFATAPSTEMLPDESTAR